MQCSFCQKSQGATGKLIASPSPYPPAYICDECVMVCAHILEDDAVQPPEADALHPLIDHPLTSQLLTAVERWIEKESLGVDAAEEIAELRSIADRWLKTR